MNNYNNNNFSRTGDPPMRFNNRPRYGVNNSVGAGGGNSKPRYKHQNQSAYQYSQNRNNASDLYQSNQYDKGPRRFYGISPKRPNHNHQQQNTNQSSPYLHKSVASPNLPPAPSTFSAAKQNALNLPPTQTKSAPPLASATITAQTQQQQLTPTSSENSNYFGFGYNNYYPASYTTDLNTSASTPAFGVADGMNSYMWQTITSVPPPKLPKQLQQPPLPEQQPPPIMPPLPGDDKLSNLLRPRPIPSSISAASSRTPTPTKLDHKNNKTNATKTVIKMKAKRKAMSTRCKLSKLWTEEDALLALKAEETNARKLQKDIILIIRFPDPEISREIVKCYSPDIQSVHFQLNFAPRYCLVHLKDGTDVEKAIDHLSKIPFGTGFLSVEIKQIPYKSHSTKLNEVDPYTLYVGNLPTTIACKTLKEHFPGAARIDIGFAQRMKYTRYAFIRYETVQKAIEAYKRMLDAEISGRTLTIRFRRLTPASERGNRDGDCEGENAEDMQDDISLNQTTLSSRDHSINLSQNAVENAEAIDRVQQHNSDHLPKQQEKNVLGHKLNAALKESEKYTTNLYGTTAASKSQPETTEDINNQDSKNNCNTSSAIQPETGEIMKESASSSKAASLSITAPSNVQSETDKTNESEICSIAPLPTSAASNIQPKTDGTIESEGNSKASLSSTDNNSPQTISTAENNSQTEVNKRTCPTPMNALKSTSQDNSPSLMVNIKPDPDIDPDDIVIRDNTIPNRFEHNSDTIKQEDEFSLYNEFFAPPNNQNEINTTNAGVASSNNDVVSLNSTADDTDTMSTLSTNSLGEFLLSCKRAQSQTNSTGDMETPPAKRSKAPEDVLNVTIKKESSEDNNVASGACLETVKQELANKSVPRRRERLKTITADLTDNSTSTQTNTTNNDDVVPPTALFFRADCQNAMVNSGNDCDYDEFYDTRKNTPPQTSNIKKEPLDISRNENVRKGRQKEPSNRNGSGTINSSTSISATTGTTAIDEDDLVPAHNLLGTYRPIRSEIKQEMEHDDLFSLPVNKTNNLHELSNSKSRANNNAAGTNLPTQLDISAKTKEASKCHEPSNDNDDDVIIISDNISRQPKQSSFNTSSFSNLFFRQHIDLVSFKPKPIAVTMPNREVSKLLHRDNLDKLYEQLDADSDSDL